MPDTEQMPYIVDLWAEDELSVRCLARAAERSIALMAFDAAAVSYPHRVVTVRGPGLSEAHQPRLPAEFNGREELRMPGAGRKRCKVA